MPRLTFLTLRTCYRLLVTPSERSIRDEVAVITGTGHGLGRQLALDMAKLGARIVCVDNNQESNDETVQLIRTAGGTAWG